jgi:hypothetical protein
MIRHVTAPLDATTLDALQLLLLVELLQTDFYTRGVGAAGLIPSTDQLVFNTILGHETSHLSTVRALISGGGGTPITQPAFDYTAKGNLPNFTFAAGQYATFTALAQTIEDLATRAYTGQLPRVSTDKAVLASVMGIHSVESRHAAEVRRLRGLKAWITGNSRDDLPVFTQPVYDGEENVTQSGVNVTAIAASFGGTAAASQAFDEPLSKDQVAAIVALFIA